MKKSAAVIGVLAVAAVGYTGASWYLGLQAQKVVQQTIETANANIASVYAQPLVQAPVRFDIVHYDRGWFSSSVQYRLSGEDFEGRPYALVLNDALEHGPFPWSRVSAGELAPMLAVSRARLDKPADFLGWTESAAQMQPWMTAQSRIDLAGNVFSTLQFRALELQQQDETLGFSGGEMTVQLTDNLAASTVQGRFGQLGVRDDAGNEALLRGIDLNSTGRRQSSADQQSELKLTVDTVRLHDQEVEHDVVVRRLIASMESTQGDSLLSAGMRYDLGEVLFGKDSLGSMTLAGRVDNVAYRALGELASVYDAIESRLEAQGLGMESMTPDDERTLHEKLLAVLAANPSLTLEPVVWKTAAGESVFNAQVLLSPPSTPPGQADTGMAMLQALKSVRMELAVSRPMVVYLMGLAHTDPAERQEMQAIGGAMFDEYVASLVQQGYVTLKGDTARAVVQYQDDTVDINGVKLPAADVMQLLFLLMLGM